MFILINLESLLTLDQTSTLISFNVYDMFILNYQNKIQIFH
jgi:hypothetical protein